MSLNERWGRKEGRKVRRKERKKDPQQTRSLEILGFT